MRMDQSGVIYLRTFPGLALVDGDLCDHKMPQSPTRFKLLVVRARLAAMFCTLVASSWFCRTVPARPLPDCTSVEICFQVAVMSSMFLVASVMFTLLVARMPWAESPSWFNWLEKWTRLLTARLTCVPLVLRIVLIWSTAPIAWTVKARILVNATPKLERVSAFKTCARKSVTEASSFWAVSSMRLMKPAAPRATSWRSNGSWQSTSALLVNAGDSFFVGSTETY